MGKTPNFSGNKQRNKHFRLLVSKVMTIVIAFHQSGYQDFRTYYIHFFYRYLTNEFPELVSYMKMFNLMQGVLVSLCSYLIHRQELPSLIYPSYRFVITYKLSDIRFLKVR